MKSIAPARQKVVVVCRSGAGPFVVMVDEFPEMGAKGPTSLRGSPVTIHLYVEDAEAAVAQAVAAGAKVTMPLAGGAGRTSHQASELPWQEVATEEAAEPQA